MIRAGQATRDERRRVTPARHLHARAALLLLGFALAIMLTGCAAPRRFEPAQNPDALPATSFLHYLATVPVVSVEEGCRAILLVTDGKEQYTTHDERYAELLRRGFARRAWRLRPGDMLDKGTLAYLACKVCNLPGGVNTLLFGRWGLGDRRYALKEVAAEGIMSYDVSYRVVRGGELLTTLTKIDAYLAEHQRYEWDRQEPDSPHDLPTAATSP
ncbi:MAG TPA: hypothetical protein VM243_20715 [Phycisphaerae bacterium]|nr:hypothetical protein [Phycisphaerae bacterium]